MANQNGRDHTYHAEAGVLHAKLELPLKQEVKPQAFATLPPRGGYLSQHAHDYRLEGVMSFRSAYTQVAGNDEPKGGWTTVATSVVEKLNILDVVTADRIVSQISTRHPVDGYVPTISFLGTRFDNLRIAGHEVKIEIDQKFLGSSDGFSTYTGGKKRQDGTAPQDGVEAFPDEELDSFFDPPGKVPGEDDDVDDPEKEETREGSLATGVELDQDDNSYPGTSFNHVITVPNFGKIYLATVHIRHTKFKGDVPKKTSVSLTMLKAKMGCIATGTAAVARSRINAGTAP